MIHNQTQEVGFFKSYWPLPIVLNIFGELGVILGLSFNILYRLVSGLWHSWCIFSPDPAFPSFVYIMPSFENQSSQRAPYCSHTEFLRPFPFYFYTGIICSCTNRVFISLPVLSWILKPCRYFLFCFFRTPWFSKKISKVKLS